MLFLEVSLSLSLRRLDSWSDVSYSFCNASYHALFPMHCVLWIDLHAMMSGAFPRQRECKCRFKRLNLLPAFFHWKFLRFPLKSVRGAERGFSLIIVSDRQLEHLSQQSDKYPITERETGRRGRMQHTSNVQDRRK